MAERRRLSDILLNSEQDRLARRWDTTKPADDLKPIPRGDYRCRVVSGELFSSRGGTPGFKLTLEVLDGEHTGRRVWHDVWLSEAALPMARRDLGKLGIDRLEQLERPLPEGIVVAARVALRRRDDGGEYNAISRFDVVAIEPPAPEPFAPGKEEPGEGASDSEPSTDGSKTFDWTTGEFRTGEPAQ